MIEPKAGHEEEELGHCGFGPIINIHWPIGVTLRSSQVQSSCLESLRGESGLLRLMKPESPLPPSGSVLPTSNGIGQVPNLLIL